MATYNLPDLRRQQLTSTGTITVPSGETWIIKIANTSFNLDVNRDVTITATINSLAYIWGKWTTVNIASRITVMSDNLIAGTVILKTGDTIVVSASSLFTGFKLDIGYYILESDF